jgi:hypothetical protein
MLLALLCCCNRMYNCGCMMDGRLTLKPCLHNYCTNGSFKAVMMLAHLLCGCAPPAQSRLQLQPSWQALCLLTSVGISAVMPQHQCHQHLYHRHQHHRHQALWLWCGCSGHRHRSAVQAALVEPLVQPAPQAGHCRQVPGCKRIAAEHLEDRYSVRRGCCWMLMV